MKLSNILAAGAALALTVGCAPDYEVSHLSEIQLSKTFVTIPEDGSEVTIEVTASVDWSFDKLFEYEIKGEFENHKPATENRQTPEWLAVEPLSGVAGTTTVTFKAIDEFKAGREAALVILAGGQRQNLIARQGEIAAKSATCAEVIDAADGQSFTVTGTCTSIVNTQYGNWYLNDGTGEIYIYGTVNDSGQNAWNTFNIEVGDEVTVSGSKVTYGSTIEFVNAKFISVKKSLLQVPENGVTDFLVDKNGYRIDSKGTAIEGANANEVVAEFVVKGNGILFDIPEDMQTWAQVTDMEVVAPEDEDSEDPDITKVRIKIASSDGSAARTGVITFRSESGKDKSEVAVSVTQVPNGSTLADVLSVIEPEKGTYVKTTATIAATCRNGFLLHDNGKYLLVNADGFDYNSYKDMRGHTATVAGLACLEDSGYQIKDIDILAIDEEAGSYKDPDPVTLDAEKIDQLAAQTGALEIKHFTATGSLVDPDHDLVVNGAKAALAFYGNDSKIFDLNKYCDYCNKGETKQTITVTGYYISKDSESGKINFIVTDIEPDLKKE